MPDQTLAQRIKAKYPGEYDDIPDAELEKKIKTKFPGEYDDLPSTPEGKSHGWLADTAWNIGKGAVNKVGEMAKGMYESIPIVQAGKFQQEHPIDFDALDKAMVENKRRKAAGEDTTLKFDSEAFKNDPVIQQITKSPVKTAIGATLRSTDVGGLAEGQYDVTKGAIESFAKGDIGGGLVEGGLAVLPFAATARAVRKARMAEADAAAATNILNDQPQPQKLLPPGPPSPAITRSDRLLRAPAPEGPNPFIANPEGRVARAADLPSDLLPPEGASIPAFRTDHSAVQLPPRPRIEPWNFDAATEPPFRAGPRETTGGFPSHPGAEAALSTLTDAQARIVRGWLDKFDDVRQLPELPGASPRELVRNQKLVDAFVDAKRALSAGQEGLGYPHNIVPRRFMPNEVQSGLVNRAGSAVDSPIPPRKVAFAPDASDLGNLPGSVVSLTGEVTRGRGRPPRTNIPEPKPTKPLTLKERMAQIDEFHAKGLDAEGRPLAPSIREAESLIEKVRRQPDSPQKSSVLKRLEEQEAAKGQPAGPPGRKIFDPVLEKNTVGGPQAAALRRAGVASRLDTVVDSLPDSSLKSEIINQSGELAKEVGTLGTIKNIAFASGAQRLEKMGPVGARISQVLRDSETASSRLGGQYVSQIKEVRKTLTKAEELDVVKMMDGERVANPSPATQAAYKQLRKLTDDIADTAISSKVTLKNPHSGARMLFQKLDGEYFPRRYTKETLDKLFTKDSQRRIEQRLVESGVSIADAKRRVQDMVKFGERYTDSQYGRTLTKDLPHEMSLDVLERYAYDMSRRIEETKRLGSLDIGDTRTPISQLIAKLPENLQKEAGDIVGSYLGRDIKPEARFTKAAGTAAQIEVATKLTNFMIKNLGDFKRTIGEAGWTPTLKQIYKAITDSKSAKKSATSTGAFEIFHNNILQDPTFGTRFTKAYGLEGVESFIRTVGANVGKSLLESKFNALKKNPSNKVLRQELSHFIEGNVDDLLKKDKLSANDLDFAGGRFVELTSGKPNALSLPPMFFTANPLARLPLLFKRFAFVSSKNMKDSIKRSYVAGDKVGSAKAISAKIARETSAAIIIGELTGDLIEGIKAGASGENIIDAIKERGDLPDRIKANMMQTWLLGMVGDVYQATKSRTAMADLLAGPVYSDVIKIGAGVGSLIKSETEGGKPRSWETRFGPLRDFVAHNLPIPLLGKGLGSLIESPETKKKSKYGPNIPDFGPTKAGR